MCLRMCISLVAGEGFCTKKLESAGSIYNQIKKDMDQEEVMSLVAVLAFMVKVDEEIHISEKKTFRIICNRFGLKSVDLNQILVNPLSLRHQLQDIHTQDAKTLLVNLLALISAKDGIICHSEEHSLLKIMEILGESISDYPFFDQQGMLNIDKVLNYEMQFLAKLPPIDPI